MLEFDHICSYQSESNEYFNMMHNIHIILDDIKILNKYNKIENINIEVKINNLDLLRHYMRFIGIKDSQLELY